MNIHLRQFIQTAIFMALICLFALLFIISTQSTDQINFLDNFWYLNRARLIWHGILPDLFVYTLAYPTFVGAIDLVVKDAILSGMIANTVVLWCLLMGIYILGCWLYGQQRVAWLAVLVVMFNASLMNAMRLFWATLPFMTINVWIVVVSLLLVRHPSIGSAILLGGIIALATYTRVEGATYSIAIPIVLGIVYRQRRDWRLAVGILITAGLVLAVLCIPFALNFIDVNRHLDRELSDGVTGIVTLVSRNPIEWFVIWRRVTDTLTGTLAHWPLPAWIIAIAGVIWAAPRYRRAQWLLSALIGFNMLYTFALAIWPGQIHLLFYIPFFALIFAPTLDQLLQLKLWTKYLAQVLLMLILLPGIFYFISQFTNVPIMAYRTSELAQTGRSLDEWLQLEGLGQAHIYTFCSSISSFSRADFQLMYRLQFTTGWDRPERLIPRMRQEGALLMLCGNPVYFPDWKSVLAQDTPTGMHEVGRFQNYIFYRPDEM